jgi:preprotein translocase subunit YajC
VVKSVDNKENQLEVEISEGVSIKILKIHIAEIVVKAEEKTKNKK